MARMARLVVPGFAHHVTQRGNRRQKTFFGKADYDHYIRLMAWACETHHVDIWAYCLMPNHVHLILVPEFEKSLAASIGEAHRRYTSVINSREGWQGHLWQERFFSCVMDEHHLLTAARYIELNPVRAGLVASPAAWPFSSARAHLAERDDLLVSTAPLLSRVHDWAAWLKDEHDDQGLKNLRLHSRTGRPIGSDAFIETIESISGRSLKRKKPGPKKPLVASAPE